MMHSTKSGTKPKRRAISFEAIGTHWKIEYESDHDLQKAIVERIERFDKTYSRFRDDSLIYLMSQHTGRYELPEDSKRLFEFYRQVYELTDGAVTPLIGSTLSDAGYDKEYSLQFKKQTVAPKWDDVLVIEGATVTVTQPVILDMGAAGKGYLVDIICDLLKSFGVRRAVVDAGGDIATFSDISEDTTIALQHPGSPGLAVGVAKVANQSLCGSSIHLRNWGSHHHIIDPHTGISPMDIRAVWVVADNTLVADGLSTALFFVPPEKLQTQFSFKYAIINHDYSLRYSPGFPGTFFDEEGDS